MVWFPGTQIEFFRSMFYDSSMSMLTYVKEGLTWCTVSLSRAVVRYLKKGTPIRYCKRKSIPLFELRYSNGLPVDC